MNLRVLVSSLLVAFTLASCTVTSIDSETKALIDACKQIKDEPTRVDCLLGVRTPKGKR